MPGDTLQRNQAVSWRTHHALMASTIDFPEVKSAPTERQDDLHEKCGSRGREPALQLTRSELLPPLRCFIRRVE